MIQTILIIVITFLWIVTLISYGTTLQQHKSEMSSKNREIRRLDDLWSNVQEFFEHEDSVTKQEFDRLKVEVENIKDQIIFIDTKPEP